ncbi:MAG: LysR family transcriptional regulator [Neomegalonema sp.]|nr:LysR family transcriptional regulator [Neomegalonema sp.]
MRYLETFKLIEAVARAGSVRKAAEDLNLTASALNRRVQAFEEEFGAQVFERLPRGMRLNPAGELLMAYFRTQRSELERLRSQVADLSGARRGHVSIACSQALMPYFLPEQIAQYRQRHPGVTFSVQVRDRASAERDLSTFKSDLALVFEPIHMVDFEVLFAAPQPLQAVMAHDHPLARKSVVRLRDCLAYPHAAPTSPYGVRHLLETAVARKSISIHPIVESDSFEFLRHYVLNEGAVTFQIPIGLRSDPEGLLAYREVSQRDVPAGRLLLGQMRGRTLPVASAKFAMQLTTTLSDQFDPE